MKISKYNIISIEDSRNKHRVIFNYVLDDRTILGSFVEHRPLDEDHNKFIEGMIPQIEKELNQPIKTQEEQLRENLFFYSDDIIKSALKIDDAKLQLIKEN